MHVFYVILFDQVIDTSSARGGVLECIELSSMVDFSMGTIYLMVGYMTSGHGPLHVPRADLQLKPMKTGAVAGRTTRRRTTERTHAGAGSRRHPAQGARPQQSKAVVVHGRVGAGITGVHPPLCVTRVRGISAAAHAEDQHIAGVLTLRPHKNKKNPRSELRSDSHSPARFRGFQKVRPHFLKTLRAHKNTPKMAMSEAVSKTRERSDRATDKTPRV